MRILDRLKDWAHDYYPEVDELWREVIQIKVKSLWSESGIDPLGPELADEYLRGTVIWMTYNPRKFKRADLEETKRKVQEYLD